MVGAAGALFVAIHVGSNVLVLMTQGFLIVMMIAGAVGFYLGIDTPPHRAQWLSTEIAQGWSAGKVGLAELLTSLGTFLAALSAFVSVVLIVNARDPSIGWALAIMAAWVLGTAMQIVAGAVARWRR
jgi:hypothetical protein